MRRSNRRGTSNLINSVPPTASTAPQRYGPGTLLTNITIPSIQVLRNTDVDENLGALLKSNLEFTELIGKYQYFRLVCLKVVLLPYFYNNAQGNGAFLINWDGQEPGNILMDDSAKLFSTIIPRTKVWKFIPPKMVIGTTNTDSAPVDLSQFINSRRFVLPVWFHAFQDFANSVTFRIEFTIQLRGLVTIPTSSKLKNILTQLELIEKLEEERKKKEEKKVEMKEEGKEEKEEEEEIKKKKDEEELENEKIMKEIKEKLMKMKIQ